MYLEIHLPCNIFYIVYRHERIHVPRIKVRGISNFMNKKSLINNFLVIDLFLPYKFCQNL